MPYSFFIVFFVFPFPFAVPRFPLPFRFVVFVCFLYRLLRFFFRFPALLVGGFCYFVSVLHPPCAACEPASLCIPRMCCLLSFLAFLILILIFFFSSFPIFRIRFGRRLFHPVLFLWVSIYAVSSVSVSVVCVLHIKPSFYPSTSSTPSVILPPREIQTSSVVKNLRHRDTPEYYIVMQ